MRFTLGTMFLYVTGVAAYLAIAFAATPALSLIGLTLVTYAMAPIVTTGVVYDRDYARTFWIGCAAAGTLPYIIALSFSFNMGFMLLMEWEDISSDEARPWTITVTVCHGLVLVSGCIAIATRWLIERKNRKTEANGSAERSILSRRVVLEAEPDV